MQSILNLGQAAQFIDELCLTNRKTSEKSSESDYTCEFTENKLLFKSSETTQDFKAEFNFEALSNSAIAVNFCATNARQQDVAELKKFLWHWLEAVREASSFAVLANQFALEASSVAHVLYDFVRDEHIQHAIGLKALIEFRHTFVLSQDRVKEIERHTVAANYAVGYLEGISFELFFKDFGGFIIYCRAKDNPYVNPQTGETQFINRDFDIFITDLAGDTHFKFNSVDLYTGTLEALEGMLFRVRDTLVFEYTP